MSLGLLIIGAFSGMITSIGLYFGGHTSFLESLGAYSLTGMLMVLLISASLILESENT